MIGTTNLQSSREEEWGERKLRERGVERLEGGGGRKGGKGGRRGLCEAWWKAWRGTWWRLETTWEGWREWAGGLGGEVREIGVGFRSLGGVSRGSGKARWGSFRREGEAWVGLALGKGGRAWGEEEMA